MTRATGFDIYATLAAASQGVIEFGCPHVGPGNTVGQGAIRGVYGDEGLQRGAKPQATLIGWAQSQGISQATLYRAKQELGIVSSGDQWELTIEQLPKDEA